MLSTGFSWNRLVIRTLYIVGITFIAMCIPHFSIILGLVGGTTIAFTSFIFPPISYLLLSRQFGDLRNGVEEREQLLRNVNCTRTDKDITSFVTKLILSCVIIVGVAAGLCSTYAAFDSLVNGQSKFTEPCFANWTVR